MTIVRDLAQGIISNQRRAISKALTLLESDLPNDASQALELLRRLPTSNDHCRRVAISGTPGVGKSSFIEMIGCELVNRGKKVAVLAIDPTSPVTGGSILGDKTRMEKLSASEMAFIRPSPSKGVLGGVARATRQASQIFAAAGYDYIFIETVGVGQSETLAHLLVDCFVVLHLPNSGDELQGIKKGITELADIVVVHKADDDNLAKARAAKSEITQAAQYYHRTIPVILASSVQGSGKDSFLRALAEFFDGEADTLSETVCARRAEHNAAWLREELKFLFDYELKNNSKFFKALQKAESSIQKGEISVEVAASNLLKNVLLLK